MKKLLIAAAAVGVGLWLCGGGAFALAAMTAVQLMLLGAVALTVTAGLFAVARFSSHHDPIRVRPIISGHRAPAPSVHIHKRSVPPVHVRRPIPTVHVRRSAPTVHAPAPTVHFQHTPPVVPGFRHSTHPARPARAPAHGVHITKRRA